MGGQRTSVPGAVNGQLGRCIDEDILHVGDDQGGTRPGHGVRTDFRAAPHFTSWSSYRREQLLTVANARRGPVALSRPRARCR